MKSIERNISRASYAPSGNREFIKQAVAHQRVENRRAVATGVQESRRPVLGKNAQDTQKLRNNLAAMTIQAEFRAKKSIEAMEKSASRTYGLKTRAAQTGNGASSRSLTNYYSHRLKNSLVMKNKDVVIQKEKSHAAATVMPKNSESLGSLRPDSDLQILGHGAAGVALLNGTRNHTVSLNQVAKGLKSGGMSHLQQNVHMESCGSADALLRASYVSIPEDTQREESTLPDHANPLKVAPAKSLANAMKARGFQGTTVTGYQGLGLTDPVGLTQERIIDSTDKHPVPSLSVKHTFKAD